MNLKSVKIIAVDFDGTLCENNWPGIGAPNEELIEYLRNRKKDGDKLILWTCRVEDMLQKAVEWCKERNLVFDAVNENLPEIIENFGSDTRKIFANEYIDDRNIPLSSCREKSNTQTWAEKEVEIACENERKASGTKEGEWDYGCACYESALKAYHSLSEDGHSGFSIGMTKYILNRLIDGKPLTSIEDTEDVWSDITDLSGYRGEIVNYQCKRMSSLFKYVYSDGTVKYHDVDRYCGINMNNPYDSYHSGLIDRVMEEKFPITMPYFPASKPFKVYCENFLVDPENGDYDTVGIFYTITPEDCTVKLNRFFKEENDEFVEIAKAEYDMRKHCHGCFGAANNDCLRCEEELQYESEQVYPGIKR